VACGGAVECGVCKTDDVDKDVGEVPRKLMIESLTTSPATPLLLGQVRETVKDLREWVELGFPMFAGTADGFHELRPVLFVTPTQNVL